MGFLWDLIQQSEINKHGERAATLEGRVAVGKDLDGDGSIGPRR